MTPTPPPAHPPERRDIVMNILNMLELAGRATFSKSEIVGLGVSVETFDANEDLIDSETEWLFEPMSKKEIKWWKLSADDAAEVQETLDIPNLDVASQALNITGTTMAVFLSIETQFALRQRGSTYMARSVGWGPINPDEFYGGNKGFLYCSSGKSRGVDTPDWGVRRLNEWTDGEILAGPSVSSILCTNRVGEEDALLISELGAIAQIIAFRRTQAEFQTCSLFPVLMLSLFGPRHGRILHACYNRYGDKFELRVSQIFCFATKDDPAFDTFLRFAASYPPEITNPNFSDTWGGPLI